MNDINPTQPVQWFYRDFPGGDLALVGVFVILAMIAALWVTKGKRYSGPVTLVAALVAFCLSAVSGFISSLAVVILLFLALLVGVFLYRWARIR